jgi:hypothetical protein
MQDTLNQHLGTYLENWQKLVQARNNTEFFASLKPVAVGWKVADRAEYDKLCHDLHDACDKIIETWMNGRWIAKLHLKDSTLNGGITIIKVMQRRPGSSDALGLDHVDFYGKRADKLEEILKHESGLTWTWESNDAVTGYRWISLWFNSTEAKVRDATVLDTIIGELAELNNDIIA